MASNREIRYRISEELWEEIKSVIPGEDGKWGGKAQDNRDFIESVLGLVYDKEPFSTSLHWGDLGKPKSDTYNRRFTNWRKKGLWENLLPILIKYKDCDWLTETHKYEVLLKNYKLVSMLNQAYICVCEQSIYHEDYAEERLFRKFPHYMKNWKRRRNSTKTKRTRGAYIRKYTPEEQEQFRDFEY